MASDAFISLTNYLATATIGTLPSQQTGWGFNLLQSPERPLLPWRSTSTAQQVGVFDFGSNKLMESFFVVNANFTLVRIAWDNDGTFSPPDGIIDLNLRQSQNGRYQLGYEFPSPPLDRYFWFEVPAQSTTNGISYFQCGGAWVGPKTKLPEDLLIDWTIERAEPVVDHRAPGGGALSRLYVGSPFVMIEGRRFAELDTSGIGDNDKWQEWTDLDQSMWTSSYFAFARNQGHAGQSWIVRRTNTPKWTVGGTRAEGDITLEEVITP